MKWHTEWTGPRSAVGNVSDNRCESDCRSRGREFDPGPVPYFCGDWSWNNFYGHSPSAESFKNGCCQLQAKVCARSTGLLLVQACPGKSVVRWTDRPAMTIAFDLGRKATKTKHTEWLQTPGFMISQRGMTEVTYSEFVSAQYFLNSWSDSENISHTHIFTSMRLCAKRRLFLLCY